MGLKFRLGGHLFWKDSQLKGTVSVISSDPPCKVAMPDLQRYH